MLNDDVFVFRLQLFLIEHFYCLCISFLGGV